MSLGFASRVAETHVLTHICGSRDFRHQAWVATTGQAQQPGLDTTATLAFVAWAPHMGPQMTSREPAAELACSCQPARLPSASLTASKPSPGVTIAPVFPTC
eukprot:COSAG06_NODE_6858_length_2742_cov_20.017783_3_plen_102_part_00